MPGAQEEVVDNGYVGKLVRALLSAASCQHLTRAFLSRYWLHVIATVVVVEYWTKSILLLALSSLMVSPSSPVLLAQHYLLS